MPAPSPSVPTALAGSFLNMTASVSYHAPTRAFSQFWIGIQNIGFDHHEIEDFAGDLV